MDWQFENASSGIMAVFPGMTSDIILEQSVPARTANYRHEIHLCLRSLAAPGGGA